ncbi:MAG: helix-turn-helix domain-containing protein [Anaeroplasma bactoclasticum]|nr:helix-turn-helix domain-containing protein [Anaeroplasma bactoclasticum]
MTFRELMKKKGYSTYTLAKEVGKTASTIQRWCAGMNEPNCASLAKLAVVLDTSIEEMVMIFATKNKEVMNNE